MSSPPSTIAWAELLHFGLGRLHLSSRQFWEMTPREILAAAGGIDRNERGDIIMNRDRLAKLAEAYPDTQQGTNHET